MDSSLENLFHSLKALAPEARTSALDEISLRNAPLASQLKRLLLSAAKLGNFLEVPPPLQGIQPWKPGDQVSHFELVREVGSGSFGSVFLALDKSLNRLVALKITTDVGAEAQTMATLRHPSIVRLYSETKLPQLSVRLLCMDFIDGASLEVCLSDDALLSLRDPFSWLIDIALTLIEALSHAHSNGVLHLDVKPGNILLDKDQRPYLTDFNVSQNLHARNEGAEIYGGTKRYMSPEQERFCLGDRSFTLNEGSDFFSLGMVLREAAAILRQRHPQMPSEQHSSSLELGALLNDMTVAERSARQSNAQEITQRLRSCQERWLISKALPPVTKWQRALDSQPFWSLFILTLAPQLLGSAINISYNGWYLVTQLSRNQQALFQSLVLAYNAFSYPLCMLLATLAARDLRTNSRASFRLADRFFAVISLGWIPAALFFPSAIHLLGEPISPNIFYHFVLSILLAWLLAACHSYLNVLLFCLRVHYPQTVQGEAEIGSATTARMAALTPKVNAALVTVATVPLVSIVLLLWLGANPASGANPNYYRTLITLLALSAGFGTARALQVTDHLRRFANAFSIYRNTRR